MAKLMNSGSLVPHSLERTQRGVMLFACANAVRRQQSHTSASRVVSGKGSGASSGDQQ
jgi:hypothetical protein